MTAWIISELTAIHQLSASRIAHAGAPGLVIGHQGRYSLLTAENRRDGGPSTETRTNCIDIVKTDSRSDELAPRSDSGSTRGPDFIRAIVAEDLRTGRHSRVITRFPPEPNGYMHIGHAKAIVLNFDIAAETGGRCNLRFDDTNPESERQRYVDATIEDVRWLGYDWGEHLYFASDYFETMYEFAEHLIRTGHAYVDSSSEEEIREARGTVTEPGVPTIYRDRGVDESLDLFRRMRAGEFPDGAHVLRARIDLAAPNMLMRDPVLYRIRHARHYRTGDAWCIYPLYDFAHPIEDAIEDVTHSFCTLEFENNRPLYDWVVEHVPSNRPHQYEFARGNLDYTVTSKRRLLELVNGGFVSGWDDPRMPTLAGLRRRGVTPTAIRSFWKRMGIAKVDSHVDVAKFEFAIREDLNQQAPRVLCVLHPLRVTITNYPADLIEELDAPYWPRDVPREASRKLPFSRELYIDRDDFSENPPRGFRRLTPGGDVRLRYGYIVHCDEVVKNEAGEPIELRCSYDPETRGGSAPEGRTVKGTIQWVSASHALPCEVRLYDRLFTVPDPASEEGDFKDYLNPDSLRVVTGAMIEPSVRDDEAGSHYQFERLGYYCSDALDSRPDGLVFNLTVSLRDSWAKKSGEPTARVKKQKTGAARGAREAGARRGDADAPSRRVAARETRPESRIPEPGPAKRPEAVTGDPDAIAPIIDGVLADNEAKVAEYRAGKAGLLGFFVGEVMRRSGRTADPRMVKSLLERRLSTTA